MSFSKIKITGPAAAAAVLCFFMPWVLVSCNGQPVASFSGWQLAAGGVVDTALGPQPMAGSPSIFLILLAALASLGLAFVIYRGVFDIRRAAFGWVGLGALSLLLLVLKFVGAGSQASQQAGVNVGIDLRFGYWGSFLANLALVGGAVRELRAARRPAPALVDLPAAPAAPEVAPAMADSRVACAACGGSNMAGSRFCMTCGETLAQAA
jgi:hypothetical protein